MAKEVNTLKLNFNCANGKAASLVISEPKKELTSEAVEGAMTAIIGAKAIGSKDALFSEKVSAELITRQTKEIYHA